MKIGLKDIEEFIKRDRNSSKGGGEETFRSKIKKYEEERVIVVNLMRKKLRESSKNCILLRKQRQSAEKTLIEHLGGRNRIFRGIVKDVKKNGEKLKMVLMKKNVKKCKWLQDKYGMRYEGMEEISNEEYKKYGEAELFKYNCELKGENLREPEIVVGEGETLELNEDEKSLLALGPKFCVRKRLDEDEFERELEECIAKVKWELMSREEKDRREGADPSNAEIMSILTEEEKEDVEEYEEEQEARRRMVYHADDRTWNYSRKRVTDIKGNSMVVLPGKCRKFQEEANLEMLRAELKHCFKEFRGKNCNNKGEQESNLTKGEESGLKSLKKRFKNEELVVLPTDKSGRFGVMSMKNYLRAGEKHTRGDEEVDMKMVMSNQRELNGNMSMIIKFCKIGKQWNHGDRVRSTMVNNSLTLCPMYLTYKDHKGWKGENNTPPPTRPIAGGNTGMNIHISEALSEILEPLVDAHSGGNEVISTEDVKARMELLNEKNEGWSKWDWWEGKTSNNGKWECCIKCSKYEGEQLQLSGSNESDDAVGDNVESVVTTIYGDEERMMMNEEGDDLVLEGEFDEHKCTCVEVMDQERIDNWEKFWETPEGQDERFWGNDDCGEVVKQRRVKPTLMRKIRRREMMKTNGWKKDEEKTWTPGEVLEEEIQNFEVKMEVIGADVEALYPSLDMKECARIVEIEVMRSTVKWEDIDYLEGTRMIALNRSAQYCRSHPLQRVLPVRRKRTGSRPGVTGKGPMGPRRGDQEQWRFPTVKLTQEEKRMIVAEVVKIITEVMFETHLYTFGGKVYRQRRGGPIGLRGTCAIARLVMCHWDMRWKELMEKNRIRIEEYLRYMDDGRVFIYPIRPGWRWVQGVGLRYKEGWRMEDEGLTPLEITRRVIDGSMQDVLPFLKFTTEVGEGEGLWLPTLDILIRVEENNITSYRYFEKPTTTNVMVQKRSALEENSKTQILANDLVRRLGNTDTRQANTVLGGVVDQFGVKVMTSGYTLMQARRIVISGLKGWERKLRRAKMIT